MHIPGGGLELELGGGLLGGASGGLLGLPGGGGELNDSALGGGWLGCVNPVMGRDPMVGTTTGGGGDGIGGDMGKGAGAEAVIWAGADTAGMGTEALGRGVEIEGTETGIGAREGAVNGTVREG